jgi:hypothetical protein
MPGRQDENQSRVVISGLNEEKILDCVEKLRALEDEYMEEFASHAQYHYPREKTREEPQKPQQVEIKGAPWQLNSLEQFPSMSSNGNAPQIQQQNGVWGRRR